MKIKEGGVVEDNKLEPMEIVRSEMGTWTHPVYGAYLDKVFGDKEYISREEWEKFRNHFGVDVVMFWMESSVNSDD